MNRRQRTAAWFASVLVAATYRDDSPSTTDLGAHWPTCTMTPVIDVAVSQAVWSSEAGLFMFVDYPPVTTGHVVTVAYENGRVAELDHLDAVLVAHDDEAAQRWNRAHADEAWWGATA